MKKETFRLLIINQGSTSTKVAVYENEAVVFSTTIKHLPDEIKSFHDIWDQYEYRKKAILGEVYSHGYEISEFDAIVSRGGLFKPIVGGTYVINEAMLADARSGVYGNHVCSVGCQIAYDLGKEAGIPALTVDPPTCDEMIDEAKYSGIPQITRQSSYHALNQKAIARKLAKDLQKTYSELKVIVVHLGGGISVGAHYLGKVIDVNNALEGDGPFSPERAGSLPVTDLIKLCFSGQYSPKEMLRLMNGRGGLVAYLGTTDGLELDRRITQGDRKAQQVINAMAFQVVKEIGAAATVLKGEVEAIALTGGLANWKRLVELISERVRYIAPIMIYPGEDEMGSLAMGALRVLREEEVVQAYPDSKNDTQLEECK
ncbi:Butyrate kinase 2 [Sporomusa silvacetica DSM 10669]|uniref:Probable butyrate kinase n=1 Tax=Sporomusa silvacetica DSM 10669 TaxID=1123289 RepID=A0ABZ3IVE0_9FIRM|nr:butyrate kinase [Sporomusa silvacetica]OZC14273.1 butyrate kinase 2 [Sporomusa silvacetica DSM 10669]